MNETKFKNIINIKYNNKYDLSKVWYRNDQYPIEIICPIHGSFIIKPSILSNGRGCIECQDKPIKYKQVKETYNDYSTYLKDSEAFLYCVKLTNKETNESFYKVGVTTKNIYSRLSTKYFHIQPIIMYKSDIKSIYELEQSFHYIANQYSYRPVFLPNGVTECYSLSYNIPKVVHQLVCV